MTHQHAHIVDTPAKNLFITMLLNFLITIIEIVGGILSGSLSLLSDAIHNFSDGIAVIISYIAIRLSKRPRSLKYTFGLKRAEILAAIINASALIIISFVLIKEAVERISNPTPIPLRPQRDIRKCEGISGSAFLWLLSFFLLRVVRMPRSFANGWMRLFGRGLRRY